MGMRTLIGLVFSLVSLSVFAADAPYDLVVRNGTVIDGTGKAGYRADVAINGGRIVAIAASIPATSARDQLDAAGLVVAPGFIDVHTHVDDDVLKFPAAENFVRDGVTTIVSGNCGSSVRDVGGFFEQLKRRGAAVNVATLYGHNTVLRAVKGDRKGELTPEQMEQARGMVRQAMLDGAVGLSTGLIYNPGQFSPTEEIVELAKVVGEFKGIYASHMRSEGSNILAAIDEAAQVGREGKVRVQISHFKLPADAARKLGGATTTLGKVLEARQSGLEIWLDQYPYTASSTSISTMLPDALVEGGVEAARKKLEDLAQFDKTLAAMLDYHETRMGRKSFAYAVIASSPAFPQYNGKNIVQATQMRLVNEKGESPELLGDGKNALPTMEQQCRTILEVFKGGNAQMVYHTMNESEVETIMRSPLVAVASDSGLRQFNVGVPHPRGYGTNSRVLGVYARERKIISLEEAVRKMTSLPALSFRFMDRGTIKEGFVADLAVFDPKTVIDHATFEKPHAYPAGIPHVIVNGEVVLKDGKLTGKLPGTGIMGPGVKK